MSKNPYTPDLLNCDDECEAAPECHVCHMRKPPLGRDVAAEMANGMCDRDCPGYREDPQPGHLWPGELSSVRDAQDEGM